MTLKAYRTNDLPRFTAVAPPWTSALPRPAHAHHWMLENDLVQSAVCQTCGATKNFRPTFGMDLSPVGARKVTPSERLYA